MKKILLGLMASLCLLAHLPSAQALPQLCPPPGVQDDDNDCIPNGQEGDIGTNPNDADTDDDGIVDGDELLASYGQVLDPLNRDTDGDGLNDGLDIELGFFAGNPDSNANGLTDLEELTTSCGNRVLEGSEQCDDGNRLAGDGCSPFCTNEVCGNGVIDSGAGEECDDGGNQGGSDDHCEACQLIFPFCGNGQVDPGEFCDDGNLANGDACSNVCQFEICGDGFLNGFTEQCDDGGFSGPGDICDATCRLALPFCQDGSINAANEECDLGPDQAGDGCNQFCQVQVCGDAILDFDIGEQCDPGPDLADDNCDAECHLIAVVCGDGARQFPEACDDGNTENDDGCDANCELESPVICGDGVVQGGRFGGEESCDDGNTVAGDGCDANCRSERCGDSIVQREGAFFEECDDGNISDDDACDTLCQINPNFIEPGTADEIQGGSGCSLGNGLANQLSSFWFLAPAFAAFALRRRSL